MDYEKMYKAALKTAAQWIKDGCTDKEKICLKCVFPELRESEDENLKNKSGYYKAGKFWKASTLWNAVKDKTPQRVPNRYILQECTWNIGTLQRFADEIKNVQEVSLDYPIILDINGNILDGAHRVVKAYLEGKDIDIVYLGDDEWPEPDYDEEKAVKESEDERAIKIIKRLLCVNTPPASEEEAAIVDDWLEKQKENPKSADSIPADCTADAKYENSLHKVGDFLPESKRLANEVIKYLTRCGYSPVIKDDLNKKHFHIDIPRHKDEFWNSEEYKHCRDILGDYYYEGNYGGDTYTLYILREKQKEQNECPEFCSGHCVGCERNEQRDYRKLYEDIAKSKWFKQNYVGKSLGCDEEPTDAKSERVIKAARSVLNNWLDGTDCPDVSGDFAELEYAIREYDGEEKQKEQKPIQTPEEKEYIRTLKSLISDFIRDKQPEDVAFYQKIYDWLDERHIEQKPVEYLDKDEVYAIMTKLTNLSYSTRIPINSDEYKKLNEITTEVRSLLDYPIEQKQEWSEEDEKLRRNLMSLLANMRGDRITEETYQKYYPWLKSLCPSWKPSEEELEALRKAVNKLADTEVADSVRLSIMYDHLNEQV